VVSKLNILSYSSIYRSGLNLLPKYRAGNQQSELKQKQHIPQQSNANALPNIPSFRGLTGHIKKYAYETPQQIAAFAKAYPNSNGIAGNLPPSWIKKLPEDKKGEHIKQIYATFSEVIKELQKPNDAVQQQVDKFIKEQEKVPIFFLSYPEKSELLQKYSNIINMEQEPYKDLKKLEDMLTPVLKKTGITQTPVKINYEGSGYLGDVYKLTVDNEDFSLKIHKKHRTESFNNKLIYLLDSEEACEMLEEMNLHGRYIEPNRSFFLQDVIKRNRKLLKAEDNNCQFTPMYFADLNNGGNLSKYISEDTLPPSAYFDEKLAGVEHTDKRTENYKKGWLLDKGEFRIKNKVIAQNRAAMQVYLKVGLVPPEKRPKVWNKTMQKLLNNKYSNPGDVETGLVNAIELMEMKDMGRLNIPPDKLNSWLKNGSLSYHIRTRLMQSQLIFK